MTASTPDDPRANPDWGRVPVSEEDRRKAIERANLAERARLLAETDWTQLPDVEPRKQALYRPFRQFLRDITDQPGWPLDVTWPEKPESPK
jgi:hypothetical protein